MATSIDFIEYVLEQISVLSNVRYRKMFGEYMIYVNDKPTLLVCDDIVFIKKHESIEQLMSGEDVGIPYKSAKEHYILDIDNHEFCIEVINTIEPFLKVPVKKKK